MPSDRRKGDIKVLVGATIAVLLLGGFIAGAAIVTTSGSKGIECGQLTVGLASDIRNNLDGGGPYFVTGGGRCGFWLALQNGDIVAYKALQPSGCTLKLRLDHWSCGGETVPASAHRAVSPEHPNRSRRRCADRQPRHAGYEHHGRLRAQPRALRRACSGAHTRRSRFSPTSRNRTIASALSPLPSMSRITPSPKRSWVTSSPTWSPI